MTSGAWSEKRCARLIDSALAVAARAGVAQW
jgi:hypothetical protein